MVLKIKLLGTTDHHIGKEIAALIWKDLRHIIQIIVDGYMQMGYLNLHKDENFMAKAISPLFISNAQSQNLEQNILIEVLNRK